MLEIQTQPVPLTLDDQGQARIGGTRVTLDSVVAAFLDGDSAETISEQYQPLSLADVYAVIAFYLNNQRQVDQYLQERKQKSLEIRQRVEARFNPAGIRQRLLARMQKGE